MRSRASLLLVPRRRLPRYYVSSQAAFSINCFKLAKGVLMRLLGAHELSADSGLLDGTYASHLLHIELNRAVQVLTMLRIILSCILHRRIRLIHQYRAQVLEGLLHLALRHLVRPVAS